MVREKSFTFRNGEGKDREFHFKFFVATLCCCIKRVFHCFFYLLVFVLLLFVLVSTSLVFIGFSVNDSLQFSCANRNWWISSETFSQSLQFSFQFLLKNHKNFPCISSNLLILKIKQRVVTLTYDHLNTLIITFIINWKRKSEKVTL